MSACAVQRAGTCVDPGLRRDDVEGEAGGIHITDVMPAKAGTHASIRIRDARRIFVRGEQHRRFHHTHRWEETGHGHADTP